MSKLRRFPLTKRDVERLVTAADRPADGPAAEVANLRNALTPFVAKLTGSAPETPWAAMIDAAAATAGWPPARAALLRGNDARVEAQRDALWDLVTELNEHRSL